MKQHNRCGSVAGQCVYLQWCGLGLVRSSLMGLIQNVFSNQNCPVRVAPNHTGFFQSHSLWDRLGKII